MERGTARHSLRLSTRTNIKESNQLSTTAKKARTAKDVEVAFSGDRIILPQGMSTKRAISWIQAFDTEQNRAVQFTESFMAYPTDGAYALYRALKELYGFTSLKATPSFFGEEPPRMIGVEISPGEIVKVPWGRIAVPGIDGYLETGFIIKDNRFIFKLDCTVKRKHENKMNELSARVKQNLKERSLYKGQAIRVKFAWNTRELQDEVFDPLDSSYTPRFIQVGDLTPDDIILNDDTQAIVDVSVFTPIREAEKCRKLGIPLHRGILLEGPYGTGKTLTATVLGNVCVEHGWTFVYLDDVTHLEAALNFARDYQPAVVFAEDIDRVVSGARNSFIDGILNTIQGVNTRDHEIMMVLTTNYVEKINRAMLRPGRLDAVISMDAPNAKSVEKLVRMYAGSSLPANADLSVTCENLKGQIPATIREVVERAKLAAIRHGGGDIITADDMDVVAIGMNKQIELLSRSIPRKLTGAEAFGRAVAEVTLQGMNNLAKGQMFLQDSIKDETDDGTLDITEVEAAASE